MNEETRKMILRLQKEDLTVQAKLWTASPQDDSEYQATLRVYRRQLSLMDHYLSETRQVETTKDLAETNNGGAVESSHKIVDDNASVPLRPRSEDMFVTDVSDVGHQKKVEQLMAIVPGRDIGVLLKALQICNGRLDDALDYILRQEENNTDIEVIELASSASTSETATCAPPSQTTEHPTAPTTTLEHSVNHLTALDDPYLETQASAVTTKEPETESVLSVHKDTVGETSENPLRLSSTLSSPALRASNAELRRALCDIPPKFESRRPMPRSETVYQGATESMTPETYLGMMRLNDSQHNQQNDNHGNLHQLGDCSQQLPRALDANAFSVTSTALQKQMLGEALYPKILEQQFKFAALYPRIRAQQSELVSKLTGMLLVLDNAELSRLTTDEAALSSNVNEAMRVLDDSLAEDGYVFV